MLRIKFLKILMKKLLLTIPFLLIASCSTGPKDKVENFNVFGDVIGEFNCTSGELKFTGGNDVEGYPLNKWLSKQDIVDLSEDVYDSAGNLVISAEGQAEMTYELIQESVVCE